ncbi:MAG: peptidoglycan-binding domain-containing protein [Candidatus Kaiserbacteria bacterium]|nr:peptidoglycan-binding domain-containing protein [Candidatus Kaiserbacteria bacterium]
MKNIYSGVVMLAILTASALLVAGSVLFSSSSANAHAKDMPFSRTHTVQGVHAPTFPKEHTCPLQKSEKQSFHYLKEKKEKHGECKKGKSSVRIIRGVHAPVFEEEEAYRSHRDDLRAFHRIDRVEILQEKIEKREEEIKHLEQEIEALRQKLIHALSHKIREIEKEIVFLSQNQESAVAETDDLSLGDQGPEVQSLQEFLNRNGFALAATGPGAPGEETDYFGPRTLRALRLFQGAHSIPVTGMLDAATDDAITSAKTGDAAENSDEKGAEDMSQEEEKPRRTLVSFLKQFFRSIFGDRSDHQE